MFDSTIRLICCGQKEQAPDIYLRMTYGIDVYQLLHALHENYPREWRKVNDGEPLRNLLGEEAERPISPDEHRIIELTRMT